jgi:dTDP-4-amino-4,6-dideoxygalactose transaminase
LGLEERDEITAGGGALLFALNRQGTASLRPFRGLPPEYCLPDMNAAMACEQLKQEKRNLSRRAEIAALYASQARKGRHRIFAPVDGTYNNYAFALVLETGAKDARAYAAKKEIAVETAFEDTLVGRGIADAESYPLAWSLSLRTMLFPLHARLTNKEAERVSKLLLTLP